jgi:hypothetical protein
MGAVAEPTFDPLEYHRILLPAVGVAVNKGGVTFWQRLKVALVVGATGAGVILTTIADRTVDSQPVAFFWAT